MMAALPLAPLVAPPEGTVMDWEPVTFPRFQRSRISPPPPPGPESGAENADLPAPPLPTNVAANCALPVVDGVQVPEELKTAGGPIAALSCVRLTASVPSVPAARLVSLCLPLGR